MNQSSEMKQMFHEFLYQRYIMNRRQAKEQIDQMSFVEYIALHFVKEQSISDESGEGKTYFKYLSEKMQLSVQETSKMIERLSDRGMVVWSHDGNGSEGTYVILTESGRKVLDEQEHTLEETYKKIIDKFGRDNLYQLLSLMKSLETIAKSEIGADEQ